MKKNRVAYGLVAVLLGLGESQTVTVGARQHVRARSYLRAIAAYPPQRQTEKDQWSPNRKYIARSLQQAPIWSPLKFIHTRTKERLFEKEVDSSDPGCQADLTASWWHSASPASSGYGKGATAGGVFIERASLNVSVSPLFWVTRDGRFLVYGHKVFQTRDLEVDDSWPDPQRWLKLPRREDDRHTHWPSGFDPQQHGAVETR